MFTIIPNQEQDYTVIPSSTLMCLIPRDAQAVLVLGSAKESHAEKQL